jgi:phage anti-repressor protein/uncharacterized protein YukE
MDKGKDLKVIANEMLPVYENEFGEKFVDARELHRVLLVGKDFTTWIKDRIQKYGFIENEDYYLTLTKIGERQNVIRHDYILTLDTAKEIAMVQNNEMGRAVRKYFIEVEKRYRHQQPKTQAEMLLLYAQQMVEQERRMKQIEEQVTVVQHRLDNIDRIDTIGDLRQRLNKMIQKYARQNGIPFNYAWKDFVQAFNTAYRTNLELRRQNYINKTGKDVSRPQFLEEMGLLEDAIRVADKMLNREVAI